MKDEALDLALEALDIVKIHFTQNRHVNEAITAIKQALAAPVQEPYAWHYKNAAGVSAWHFGPSRMFDADLEASKMWPRTHQLIPVYTENKRSISDCEELAALGWQAITCPSCGNVGARGYPRNTTPPAQPAPVLEPVAWMYESVCGNDFACRYNPPDYAKNIRPLYTTPPAAQPAVPDAFGTREGEHPKYIEGWNDCRAEMMKGMK